MLSFAQFISESAPAADRTDISWHHHPALGTASLVGFHRHAEIRARDANFKHAFNVSHSGGTRLGHGFATIHHPSKSVEVHDYGEKWQDGTPDKEMKAQVFKNLRTKYNLKGYRMVKTKEETSRRRDSE